MPLTLSFQRISRVASAADRCSRRRPRWPAARQGSPKPRPPLPGPRTKPHPRVDGGSKGSHRPTSAFWVHIVRCRLGGREDRQTRSSPRVTAALSVVVPTAAPAASPVRCWSRRPACGRRGSKIP